MKTTIPIDCAESMRAVSDALFVLGGKWRLLIMISINAGNKRFTEIQKSISGINPKVLSDELKTLEENKLIARNVINDYPVRIEYTLTKYAKSLDEPIGALARWGNNHRKKIMRE
jgi:DNA-binding HxlR family transcriptional regulator